EQKTSVDNDSLLLATLYQQKSAEVMALSYQAYNLAELRLNQVLENNPYKKPLAIVVDVDETVLDNSPFEAKSILENSDYPTYWKEWCDLANAKSLPGAVELLNYASLKGVETFYITNRKVEFQAATMINLNSLGFPHVDDAHMLFRTSESNKESRRQKVLETYEIVILIGDNLNDFTDAFNRKSSEERCLLVDSLKFEFGKKFIVLPNAAYGSWIDAILNYEQASKEEKLKTLKEALEPF
ncbi:MAG: 5'-nucleotidase, lipoprotein e(P4) family, partial [Bacteroidetes bacterium]|nr:5'-nucleotidase, lipoprotein e(P4) family [Bacteroidota bacterium]